MKVLLRVAKEAKKYKGLLSLAAVSTLLLTSLNLVAPRLMANMTAIVSQGLSPEGMRSILWIALLLLGVYLSRILFRYLSNFMAHKAAWMLVEELRVKVYGTLQSLSLDFFRNRQSGDLVSRTISDTATFELLYAHLLPETITNVITLVGVTTILFSINAQLALMTCIPIPLILLSGWFFARKVRPNFRTMQKSLGELSAQLQDNYAGIHEIQAFGQQSAAEERARRKANTFTRAMLRALNLSAVFHPSVEFLTSLGTVIVVGFGGWLAYQGRLPIEDIVAFMLYLSLFYAPITGIANLLESMQQALAGVERVIEVLDTPVGIEEQPWAKDIGRAQGALSFQGVCFSYVEEAPVLKDVSFTIQPGQMVALVGATGVGKTTLSQLIARFYDPTQGAICLDGHDLRDIQLSSLRRNVAMVLQDTFLFSGTIAQNIAFAKPGATQDDIEAAARIARVHQDILALPEGYETKVGERGAKLSGGQKQRIAFAKPGATQDDIEAAARIARVHQDILALPEGYETKVGERGAKLSGGQKQRIAIARAVLCRAPILILDEATASVDVQTEAFIQQAILELAGTRTIIAIAHRLSTVRRADLILVFENGAIVQQGTHDELAAQPGLYREMCLVQERGAQLAQAAVN